MNVNAVMQYNAETQVLKLVVPSSSVDEINSSIVDVPQDIVQKIQEIDLSDALLIKTLPIELNRFSNVKVLRIASCHSLESLDGVQNMGISSLYASHCPKIANVDALVGKKIQVLDLSFNVGMENLNGLQSLAESLSELYLEGLPKLQTTRRLVGLRNLKVLNIKDTSIRDTSSLSFIPRIIV